MKFSRCLWTAVVATATLQGGLSQTVYRNSNNGVQAKAADATQDSCLSNLNSVCALVDRSIDSGVHADVQELSQGAFALQPLPATERLPLTPRFSATTIASARNSHSTRDPGAQNQPGTNESSSTIAGFPLRMTDSSPTARVIENGSLNAGALALRERRSLQSIWQQPDRTRRVSLSGRLQSSARSSASSPWITSSTKQRAQRDQAARHVFKKQPPNRTTRETHKAGSKIEGARPRYPKSWP